MNAGRQQAMRADVMVASAPGAVWRDIETAPKDGTEVLLLWFDSGTGATPMRRVGFWHSREQAWCDTHRVLHNQHSHPTHWTSLPSPTPADEPITAWTPAQLARYIGMSYDFVLAEIAAGELPASRFGAHWRIHSSAVWAYLTGKGFPVPVWMQDRAGLYAAPDDSRQGR